MEASYQFNIFADYFQIYVEDENAHIDLSRSWTEETVESLMAFDPDSRRGFAMGTVRNMFVPVRLDILAAPPADSDFSLWDQVNECSLEVFSGKLVLMGCSDYYPDAARVSIEPGVYRARIGYGNLDSLSENRLDGDDHYWIALWPAAYQQPAILKKRRAT